jgi:hypothetical protein
MINFKANSSSVALYEGVVNPHDEIKGSNPLSALSFNNVV